MPFTASSSKTILAFIPLLLLSYSFNTQALSATTANTIKGNAPELSAALQTEITSNTFSLLNLVATDSSGGKTTYTADTDPNFIAKINGIANLRDATLDDIAAALANDTTGTLGGAFSAPPTSDTTDIDGDGNFSLTGVATANWYYDNAGGTPVKITTTTNTLCELAAAGQSPYIQVSASNVKLITQYGDPPDTNYGNTTKKFTIATTPFACFAKPNLNLGTGVYAGPTNVWNPSYGFIPQDISTPSSNFPTTGSNNLVFYLTVVGATASEVIANSINLSQGNITIVLSPDDQARPSPNIVKVTLTGPKQGTDNVASKVTLPVEFHLKAPTPGGGTVDVYTFAIKKWFITKLGTVQGDTFTGSQTYCRGLDNYSVPSVQDYTNQFIGSFIPGTSIRGVYTRDISGALFSEWGNIGQSNNGNKDNDWKLYDYWAIDEVTPGNHYTVSSVDGKVWHGGSLPSAYGACISH